MSDTICNSEFTGVLADRLRNLRKSKRLSWDKLAEALKDKYKIKINRDTLKFYEAKGDHSKAGNNRAMKAEYLYCLADFYGVSVDYLLGITDDPKPKSSVIDDLGLPISVCDMLLEHNKAESLQRRGLEALCETGAFFDLCEKIGILCEAAKPYKPEFPDESDPQNYRRILDREDKQEEEKRYLVEKGRLTSMNSQIEKVMKGFPDLQKHGQFIYGQEFTDLLKYQVSQLMEKAMETIVLNAREE